MASKKKAAVEAAPPGATVNPANLVATPSQAGQVIKVTISGSVDETVPSTALLTLTLQTPDGTTFNLSPVTVPDSKTTTIPASATGVRIVSGSLPDGRVVTVAADGQSVTAPA